MVVVFCTFGQSQTSCCFQFFALSQTNHLQLPLHIYQTCEWYNYSHQALSKKARVVKLFLLIYIRTMFFSPRGSNFTTSFGYRFALLRKDTKSWSCWIFECLLLGRKITLCPLCSTNIQTAIYMLFCTQLSLFYIAFRIAFNAIVFQESHLAISMGIVLPTSHKFYSSSVSHQSSNCALLSRWRPCSRQMKAKRNSIKYR